MAYPGDWIERANPAPLSGAQPKTIFLIRLWFNRGGSIFRETMKKAIRYSLLSVAIAVLFATAYAVVIKDKPVAFSNGSDIVVRWSTIDESGVQRFDVLRRAGTSGEFTVISSVGQLKGSNSTYEYVDKSVFKVSSGIYQYKIRIINGQSPAPETDPVTVSHVSSAGKRTWGSIKAMFR